MPERQSVQSIDINKFKRPNILMGYETRFRQRLKEVRGTRSFKKEDEGIKEKSPTEIREELMSRFQDGIAVLGPKLAENRAREASQRQRPLITTIVSLWEENETMIASKMFIESLTDLRRQAVLSGIDLDVIVVANNGGGKTEKLGKTMTTIMGNYLKSEFGIKSFQEIHTNMPSPSCKPSDPWDTRIPASGNRIEGRDRCFFVIQPQNKLNAGKTKALRDVSHALGNEIMEGYAPDALFIMDAETILQYKPSHHTFLKQPLRAMFDALKRREGVVAMSTKNRFDQIDPETGKPRGALMPLAYEGITNIDRGTRENFVSMHGGSILVEPDYYIAGMKVITQVMSGNICDDYSITQLLRAYAGTQQPEDTIRLNSLNVITHLNRYPDGKNALNQLCRWKRRGNTMDLIFPGLRFKRKTDREYLIFAIKKRLKTLRGIPDRYERFRQLKQDVLDIPGILSIAREVSVDDPVNGSSTWEHFKTGKTQSNNKSLFQ